MTTPFAMVCRITPVVRRPVGRPVGRPVWGVNDVLVVANANWDVKPVSDFQDALVVTWQTPAEEPKFTADRYVGIELWSAMSDPFEELQLVDRMGPPEPERFAYHVFPHVKANRVEPGRLEGFTQTIHEQAWPGHWPYATLSRARQAIVPPITGANKMRNFLTPVPPPHAASNDIAKLW